MSAPHATGPPVTGTPGKKPGLLGLLSRRFGYMVLAQWGSGLLAGVFLVLLARLGPDAFGMFSLAMALGVLITMVTGAGFENYLVPRLTDGRVRMRRVLTQTLCIQFVLMLVSLGLLFALCSLLAYGADKVLLIMIIAAGMGPVAMAQSFFVLCRVQGRQDTEMRIRVASGLTGSAFGITCVLLEASPPLIACFKLAEALLLWLLIGLALRWRFSGFSARLGEWAGRWREGLIFAGIAICGLLYNKLNIYMLDHYGGSHALGLYNAPWEITDGLCILITGALIEKVMYPLMAGQWQKDRQTFMRLNLVTVQCLLLLGLFSSFLFYAEGDRILVLLYGEQYREATLLFQAQIPCVTAAFLHNLASCMLISMHLYRPVLVIYLSGLICNIVLCLLLIPSQGALGAALAISGTKIWMMVGTVALAMRVGLELRPTQVLTALLAAALAFGAHGISAPLMPREVAELLGFVPLLALAALWLPSILRGGTGTT